MNIILIGFMGTGKTAVGQRLADEFGYQYLDTDELIVRLEKMPINDIFSQKGEMYFRGLETNVVKTLQDYDKIVLSTGGGLVLRPENVTMLKALGPLVLLWAEPEVIYQRTRNETHRPLLKVAEPLKEIRKILNERQLVYEKSADITIDTSKKPIAEVVAEIKTWIRSKSH